jgi:hypothetical protein
MHSQKILGPFIGDKISRDLHKTRLIYKRSYRINGSLRLQCYLLAIAIYDVVLVVFVLICKANNFTSFQVSGMHVYS